MTTPLIRAAVLYVGFVVLLTWPMVAHFNSRVVGGADAFLFLWSLWWFGQSLILPGWTLWNCPFVLHPFGANLIQHDSPPWPNFFAWITQHFGATLTGSYNAAIWLAFWLNAVSMFALAYVVLKTEDNKPPNFMAPFTAGFVFAFAPYFIGRSGGHFGQMHVYPIVLLALCLYQGFRLRAPLYFLASGCCLVLAALSHYYYVIYGGFYLIIFYLYHAFRLHAHISERARYHKALVGVFLTLGTAALIAAVLVSVTGGGKYVIFGAKISMTNSTNVMMAWWLSWLVAFLVKYHVNIQLSKKPEFSFALALRQWGWIFLPCLLLLPFVIGAVRLMLAGDFGTQDLGWKSGPRGGYLVSLLLPNVYHPFWREWSYKLFSMLGWDSLEEVMSLGLVSMILVWVSNVWEKPWWWRFALVFFLILSLGPFLRIFSGLNEGPVLPFWFIRYIPIVGGARMPVRWIAVALIGWSVLVAYALQQIRCHRWRFVWITLIVFESLALPLSTSSVTIPFVYATIAQDQRRGAVLELPFGVRDGRRLWGQFPAENIYYQTLHQKPLVGGYLGRIPDRIFASYQQEPALVQLVALQAGESDKTNPKDFFSLCQRWNIRWIVLDTRVASGKLQEAVSLLLGQPIAQAEGRQLYALKF